MYMKITYYFFGEVIFDRLNKGIRVTAGIYIRALICTHVHVMHEQGISNS